jgi:TolB-like protein/Flp pilus assembly protein TadD
MADPIFALREGLRDRYEIERELGRGGMAAVWLARDLRYDRPVALKVLHPELAATLGPDRFQREIRMAARLQHPHILTVLDSGEVGGRLWFTMPYVEGESLRDRLRRERQLPVDDAIRVAREAAQALHYAHEQGIVHRDIKPENLLLTRDGSTLVADFGIARAVGGPADEKLTETGLAVGTPAYMSPEQAAGDRGVDARTDIYSLAAVLYEMLAGEPPYTGATTQAMLVKRLTEPAPSVRAVRPTVPEPVDAAIRKALAPVAADRFASAAELARALAVALLGLGFLLGLGVLFGWLRRHGGEPAGDVKRLAVLPFDNVGAATDEYFADGITDEIRAKLAGLPGLQVTASRSAAEYKNSPKDLATVARELGVDYLLVGKVRWEKGDSGRNRVRVSPELIQVASGSTKWEQPFEANLTDVFQVQADVAQRVAQALDVALGAGEKQALAERPTRNLTAYDAYLKGEEVSRGLGASDLVTIRRSLLYYEQAVAIDSGFAQAWAQRARAYAYLYSNGVPDPATARLALESAERARRLSPERPEGYLALAEYYRAVNDSRRSVEQAERGLALAPKDVNLLVLAALSQQALGRWEQASELLARAQAIDPRSATTSWRLARTLLFRRRYDEALAACERGLQVAPAHLAMLETRAMIHAARGDSAAAHAAIERLPAEVEPAAAVAYFANFYDLYWLLDGGQRKLLYQLAPAQFDDDRGAWALSIAGAYAFDGDARRSRAYADSATAAFADQLRNAPNDAQTHVLRGVALAYQGRKDEAIREGRRGVELMPMSENAFQSPYIHHQMARIYLLTGEPEQALDEIEVVLRVPYYLSSGWLRVDPNFAPLRSNPRFRRLAGES